MRAFRRFLAVARAGCSAAPREWFVRAALIALATAALGAWFSHPAWRDQSAQVCANTSDLSAQLRCAHTNIAERAPAKGGAAPAILHR